MTDWLTTHSSHPSLISMSMSDTHGGKMLGLHLDPGMVDTIKFMHQYRSQLEREQQIRETDPNARELYNQYQTYMNLTYSK
jgi:hypothetical protein